MSVPFYVSPEQIMARQGRPLRARASREGGSVIVMQYAPAASLSWPRHPSRALHKIRRALRPNRLRCSGQVQRVSRACAVAGVRLADMRGYSYDRSDVDRVAASPTRTHRPSEDLQGDREPLLRVSIVRCRVGRDAATTSSTSDGSTALDVR